MLESNNELNQKDAGYTYQTNNTGIIMNLINFFQKGLIKKIYLGMSIDDFNQTKLSKKITDTMYAFEDDDSDYVLLTSIGIEIKFSYGKIKSIGIDPNYGKFSLNGLKITRNTSLLEILEIFYKNNIKWKFNCRNKDNECEITTLNPYISIVFTFEKDDFWMSKILLSKYPD